MMNLILGCIAIGGVLVAYLIVLGHELRRDFSDGQKSFWEEV